MFLGELLFGIVMVDVGISQFVSGDGAGQVDDEQGIGEQVVVFRVEDVCCQYGDDEVDCGDVDCGEECFV